jgi:hypothetical protein
VIGVRGYLSGCILALAACIGLAVPVLAQDNSGLAAGKEAWARASCSSAEQRTVDGRRQHSRSGEGAASEVRLLRNRHLFVRLKVSVDVLGADHLAPIDQ